MRCRSYAVGQEIIPPTIVAPQLDYSPERKEKERKGKVCWIYRLAGGLGQAKAV
jgi:hypothetical protein